MKKSMLKMILVSQIVLTGGISSLPNLSVLAQTQETTNQAQESAQEATHSSDEDNSTSDKEAEKDEIPTDPEVLKQMIENYGQKIEVESHQMNVLELGKENKGKQKR